MQYDLLYYGCAFKQDHALLGKRGGFGKLTADMF